MLDQRDGCSFSGSATEVTLQPRPAGVYGVSDETGDDGIQWTAGHSFLNEMPIWIVQLAVGKGEIFMQADEIGGGGV